VVFKCNAVVIRPVRYTPSPYVLHYTCFTTLLHDCVIFVNRQANPLEGGESAGDVQHVGGHLRKWGGNGGERRVSSIAISGDAVVTSGHR
jgi:hypothetical protein